MKRTKIIDVLQSTEYGKEVCVKGWVRTHRSSKAVDFIALNDGSTIKNVQVVVDPTKFDEHLLKDILRVPASALRVRSLRARVLVSLQRFRPPSWRSMDSVATTILCRRRVSRSRLCVKMPTCACVPIPLVP